MRPTVQFCMRLEAEELARWKSQAGELGVSVTALVRQAVDALPGKPTKEAKRLAVASRPGGTPVAKPSPAVLPSGPVRLCEICHENEATDRPRQHRKGGTLSYRCDPCAGVAAS